MNTRRKYSTNKSKIVIVLACIAMLISVLAVFVLVDAEESTPITIQGVDYVVDGDNVVYFDGYGKVHYYQHDLKQIEDNPSGNGQYEVIDEKYTEIEPVRIKMGKFDSKPSNSDQYQITKNGEIMLGDTKQGVWRKSIVSNNTTTPALDGMMLFVDDTTVWHVGFNDFEVTDFSKAEMTVYDNTNLLEVVSDIGTEEINTQDGVARQLTFFPNGKNAKLKGIKTKDPSFSQADFRLRGKGILQVNEIDEQSLVQYYFANDDVLATITVDQLGTASYEDENGIQLNDITLSQNTFIYTTNDLNLVLNNNDAVDMSILRSDGHLNITGTGKLNLENVLKNNPYARNTVSVNYIRMFTNYIDNPSQSVFSYDNNRYALRAGQLTMSGSVDLNIKDETALRSSTKIVLTGRHTAYKQLSPDLEFNGNLNLQENVKLTVGALDSTNSVYSAYVFGNLNIADDSMFSAHSNYEYSTGILVENTTSVSENGKLLFGDKNNKARANVALSLGVGSGFVGDALVVRGGQDKTPQVHAYLDTSGIAIQLASHANISGENASVIAEASGYGISLENIDKPEHGIILDVKDGATVKGASTSTDNYYFGIRAVRSDNLKDNKSILTASNGGTIEGTAIMYNGISSSTIDLKAGGNIKASTASQYNAIHNVGKMDITGGHIKANSEKGVAINNDMDINVSSKGSIDATGGSQLVYTLKKALM